LVEDSGKAFSRILTRDRNYVRLAKYIAESNMDLTNADIQEDLPFFKGSEYHRRDLMNLAIAWGYKNNVIIKKKFSDDIEFLSGESLKETNTDSLVVSYSNHIATGYRNDTLTWEQLKQLVQTKGYHWIAHHLIEEDLDGTP